MDNLKIEYIDPKLLVPDPENAKEHTDEQVDQIVRSMETFGMNDPIGVWKDNLIVEGHGRLMAALQIGLETVPIIRLDHLTDQERRAYMLAHNKLTMNTGFEIPKLEAALQEITDFDMEQFGFGTKEIMGEEEDIEGIIEDEPPEPPRKSRAKRGDIYVLGSHRLMCGDSTNGQEVQELMGG